ncbi:RNA polymerase sigma factor SigV [Gottschalkia purinilytica]|uniref:RNA polymerase sigma factor SigV n=1 Tax=Gottschalkia purinilytica TaxID=1503 RepID=A0A0L0WA52_GOTPU|nr:RNA polymerase sigma factor [Gottschalkia purinilytica]KNF08341.1 RNA polymerase sigma factor SigV [Gottschalkia purinilytica]
MDTILLVKKAKQGDKDALVQLIMLKKQDYYKLAYVYMKNPEDTLDVMQNMIVILYENIGQLKDNSKFYSWSKTILVNCCKNYLRKNKKLISLEYVKEQCYEENFQQKDEEVMIEECLSQLKEKHREVIKLRYFLDLDYKTISNILKIPVGTVKSRIHIGLEKLKEIFGGEEL